MAFVMLSAMAAIALLLELGLAKQSNEIRVLVWAVKRFCSHVKKFISILWFIVAITLKRLRIRFRSRRVRPLFARSCPYPHLTHK